MPPFSVVERAVWTTHSAQDLNPLSEEAAMCDSARASRHYAAAGRTDSVKPATTRIRTLPRRTHVFWLSLACLAVLPWQVQAQEAPDRQEAPGRFMLEVGLAGDTRQCPGHYVGINVRVAGPVSLYGMVENYRCSERTEEADNPGHAIRTTVIYPRRVASDIRFGAEVLLGRASWLVRPALRAGILYGGGDYVGPTAGASLTFGQRYGARFILHVEECGSTACARFQMGGYVSF